MATIRAAIVEASTGYKLVFLTVTLLTVLALLAAAGVAFGWTLPEGPTMLDPGVDPTTGLVI